MARFSMCNQLERHDANLLLLSIGPPQRSSSGRIASLRNSSKRIFRWTSQEE